MVIGIIGAMNEEIIELKAIMTEIVEEKLGGLLFFKGKLKDKNVVLVEGGIGKVNGAICATLMKNHFNVDRLLFTGVAGGVNPDINIGDIVIGTDLVEHDFDCSAFGYELGKIPRMDEYQFKADENLRKIAMEVAIEAFGKERVWEGRIVSGDQFVASPEKIKWLRETFNGYCTEMEGAAIAQACYLNSIPFLIVRAISDKADDSATVDYPAFEAKAIIHSVNLLTEIVRSI